MFRKCSLLPVELVSASISRESESDVQMRVSNLTSYKQSLHVKQLRM